MIYYIKKYISFYRKTYIPFILILFCSTFLLSSLYIAKDSYDAYNLNATIEFYGNYDIKGSLYDYQSNKTDKLTIVNYESSTYITSQESITYATNLDVYPIQIIKGKMPKRNQIILHEKFKKKYKIGQSYHGYTISGFYNNLNPELVNSTAYVKINSKKDAMTFYAFVKNKEDLSTLSERYEVNENLVQSKYHLNTSFESLFLIFYLIITLYCFLLIYSALKLHHKKQANTFHRLRLLAFSNNQITKWILIEYTTIFIISVLISLLTSIGLWFFLTNLPIHSYIPLRFNLEPIHLFVLILSLICIYVLSILLILFKQQRKEKNVFHFKKIQFKTVSISPRLILLDSIRTGYGLILILLICLSTSFVGLSNTMIQTWKEQINNNIQYEHEISATYNIFDHDQIPSFISKCNKIVKGTKNDFNYTINSQAFIGQNEIETQITSGDHFVLTNADSSAVTIKLLKVGQETIDTIYINELENKATDSEETILYIPKSKVQEWLNTYPDTYLTGSLWINTNASNKIYSRLKAISLSSEDEIYIINHEADAQTIQNSLHLIFLFIYGFYAIVIITCIFVSYCQISQYVLSRKKEIELMHTLGISHIKIKTLYTIHILSLILIALFISFFIQII